MKTYTFVVEIESDDLEDVLFWRLSNALDDFVDSTEQEGITLKKTPRVELGPAGEKNSVR